MLCVLIVCVASACIVRADGVHLGMRVNAHPPSVHLSCAANMRPVGLHGCDAGMT